MFPVNSRVFLTFPGYPVEGGRVFAGWLSFLVKGRAVTCQYGVIFMLPQHSTHMCPPPPWPAASCFAVIARSIGSLSITSHQESRKTKQATTRQWLICHRINNNNDTRWQRTHAISSFIWSHQRAPADKMWGVLSSLWRTVFKLSRIWCPRGKRRISWLF